MRRRGQTLIEKIAQRVAVDAAPGSRIFAGDYLSVAPHRCMTHDNSGAVIKKFDAMGVPAVKDAQQLVFALDHNVQDTSSVNLEKYAKISSFAERHGIDFHPAGRGIGHQVMVEEGHVLPDTMVVASDSHSNMYGGLGCLGTPLVRTDAASIWATGKTWWQVPQTARCVLKGSLPAGTTSKDLIIMLCGHFRDDQVLNHAIEFCGDGVASLSVEDRLTVANMSTEWGALAGVFPADEVTFDWLDERAAFLARRGPANVPSDRAASATGERYVHPRLTAALVDGLRASGTLRADEGAQYSAELEFDLRSVSPHVSGPNHVKTMAPLAEMEARRLAVHKAYIVSCVNSRPPTSVRPPPCCAAARSRRASSSSSRPRRARWRPTAGRAATGRRCSRRARRRSRRAAVRALAWVRGC